MNSPSAAIPFAYRQPVWGSIDGALKNSFRSSGILGLLILVAIFVVPRPADNQLSLEKMPERFARLIVETPPAPVATPSPADRVAAMETPQVEAPAKIVAPRPVTRPRPSTRRRDDRPRANPDAGRRGRDLATAQVALNLDEVQGSLDKVLDELSAALPAADAGSSEGRTRRRRSRTVRSGRSRTELAAVRGVQTTDASSVGGEGLESNGITISSIAELGGDGANGAGGGSGGSLEGGSEGGGGESRSSASLLAVVRRYAAGIQFCYDNQLKKDPGLRGKLIISLTVLANGEVSRADVVQNGLGNDAVVGCVLAQIRAWQFPAIPSGVVSFKTPFLFTPPE